MKNINPYYGSYQGYDKRIDYLKYGLMNEFGYDFEGKKEFYNEEKIIKKECNLNRKLK